MMAKDLADSPQSTNSRRFTYERPGMMTSAPRLAKKSKSDFRFSDKLLGEGSFSTVYRCFEVETEREFAMKICERAQIKRERKGPYIMREKEVMAMLANDSPSPFLVQLYCTFQDRTCLCFVMTLAPKGELLQYLKKLGSFDDAATRFYASEILDALDYIHRLGIIHRDLKPENILLADDMHILISDFGSAKIIGKYDAAGACGGGRGLSAGRAGALPVGQPKQRGSFVGTAQYVSPEVLTGKDVTPACDFWALGCIVYQMRAGLPPFRAASVRPQLPSSEARRCSNEYLVFQKIIKLDYAFPRGFPDVALDLVDKLLAVDASARLGSAETGGACRLRAHPFFDGVDWATLHEQTPPALLPTPPAPPYLRPRGDQTSFHSEPGFVPEFADCLAAGFTQEAPRKSHILDMTAEQRKKRMDAQRKGNPFHRFVDDNLILKSGYVDKKKGLFARRRMFLLTEGPHLYYVNPVNMELKGQIPWCAEMSTEAKDFKTFFIQTPNRVYYLFDREGRGAHQWCAEIDEVKHYYFSTSACRRRSIEVEQ